MRETDWTNEVLGWPGGIGSIANEINEAAKTLGSLWVRTQAGGNRKLVCSGCGRKLSEAYDTYEREVQGSALFLSFCTTVR